MKLAQLIETRCTELQLTYATLAERVGMGVSKQYISDLAHGKRTAVSQKLVPNFISVLGVSREVFYFSMGRVLPELLDLEVPADVLDENLRHLQFALVIYHNGPKPNSGGGVQRRLGAVSE